jgi:hypothetical protein
VGSEQGEDRRRTHSPNANLDDVEVGSTVDLTLLTCAYTHPPLCRTRALASSLYTADPNQGEL